MSDEMVWYIARASGIVTWALLAASVSWGLALTTGTMGRRPRPAWLLDLHRFMAGSALVFLAVHVGSIAADTYVHFGPVSLLVPFTGHWHPVAVAWGIIAMYVLVAVEVTSLLRAHLPKKLWRASHYASFPLFALATLHALTAGTDRHNPGLRYTVIAVTAGVTALAAVRAVRADRRQPLCGPRLAPRRRGALP